MAARPMIVTSTVTITYDGVPVRIPRGTIIDVPSGSALNTALGANITAATSQQVTPGGSDSVGVTNMYNAMGGGVDPYNWGQAG